MRSKKTGIQIGEERSSSDSKSPQFQLQESSVFDAKYVSRIPHLQIQLPARNCDEQPPNFKDNTTTTQKTLLSNPQKRPMVMIPQLKTTPDHHRHHPVLLSSFNINSFHATNLPSIRLFVARNFPNLKLYRSDNASKTHPPVVWSIGSKTRLEENTNSGFLVKVYSNGDVYEGEFYKGKCSGSGVYYYNLNGRYEGDWVDQKYDGYGVETWAKGSRYRGQYRQGLRHGYGVYRFYTGDMYAGEWFKGQCHGYGIHTCEDGSKYSGEFKGGIKHGLGHYRFRNGDTYAGEYFADKMHGFGVYRFANGHRYEGAWHEGRRQGFGMYTFRNGDTQSGHWDNGVLTVSTSRDSFLFGSSSSISHAKVLKAVQEARRIAEKAVAAADVDERVNRAVTAANRAANAARVAAVKAVQNQMHQHGDSDDLPLDIV
ncbi:hypothetical protein E3N88_30713 [Mikania micrantha]|uniref:Uncharacterized protein n=1 Tax=Mikania micrantha TaxID=192012 RepID=A0A5N6MND1_9ASTR|nr:hypothetical protein E3N88_30713 [Mikania micrantha]